MDYESELINSLRSASRSALTLLVFVLVVSVYMGQRAVLVLSYVPDVAKVRDPYGDIPQVAIVGMQFTYGTLSRIWPLILGALCLCFRHMVGRQLWMWRRLLAIDPHLSESELLLLDPIGLAGPSPIPGRAKRVAWTIITAAPLVALSLHLATTTIPTLANGLPLARFYVDTATGIQTVFRMVVASASAAIGVWGAMSFPRSVSRLRRTFEMIPPT
jgi:hypothetical protein